MITYGDFLYQPQWNKHPVRRTKFEVIYKCVANQEEVETLTADEIQKRIEEAFVFDEYKWQLENKIKVKSKYRAHNLHKVLYKCPHCEKDYSMCSNQTRLWCQDCGIMYEMNEYGQLICLNNEAKFNHVPDWYDWERQEVNKEVRNGTYYFEDEVRIEHLVNAQKGFKNLGNVNFVHDMNGIHLHGKLLDGKDFNFDNEPIETPSIHIDYSFKKRGTVKRGQALDINTIGDTWFIYLSTQNEALTKIHFAVEALYDLAKEKIE